MDVRANIDEEILPEPMKRVLVKTGLFLEIPVGYEAQIQPRSGMALNKVVTALNSPGTIDADYRGEVCVILINISDEKVIIKESERICRMIIAKNEHAEWLIVDELVRTERGEGGFGHTGEQ